MKKELRQKVYDKCGGHCAYCGSPLEYKDMQVDHILPKRQKGSTDDISNLLPTCRLCNHYKRGYTLYQFKYWLLGQLIERIRKIYIVRVAEKYGMVEFHEWDEKFYYEKQNNMNKIEFNTQICTTKEQSKRLLELGVNPNTADMCWFNDMQKPSCAPYKCFVDRAQDMKWVIYPAWSLHRLIELYKDVEDTSMWSLENVNYNRLIQCIGLAIKHDAFNKDYLR